VKKGSIDGARFKVSFPGLTDKEGQPLVVDVLHGNMALIAARAAMFKDWVMFDKVLNTAHPNDCRDMGRLIKNYHDPTWQKHVNMLAFEIVKHKVLQCKVLRELVALDLVEGLGCGTASLAKPSRD